MKKIIIIALITFISGFCFLPVQAKSEPIELDFAFTFPGRALVVRGIAEPWAKKIEALTNNKVKINIHPNDKLGFGKGTFDAMLRGDVDITMGTSDMAPGRFPLTDFISLPYLVKNAEQGSFLLSRMISSHLQDEYKDIKLMFPFCTSPLQIHTVNKQVKRIEDLNGLRLNMGGKIVENAMKQMGVTPVSLDGDKIADALKNGEVDGVVFQFQVLGAFKLMDHVKYHTIVNMTMSPLFVGMNKAKYESLPPEIRKVFDENSGEKMSIQAGQAFDKSANKIAEACIKKGHEIYVVPDDEMESWREVTISAGNQWVDEMKAKGLPGDKVLESAMEILLQIQ